MAAFIPDPDRQPTLGEVLQQVARHLHPDLAGVVADYAGPSFDELLGPFRDWLTDRQFRRLRNVIEHHSSDTFLCESWNEGALDALCEVVMRTGRLSKVVVGRTALVVGDSVAHALESAATLTRFRVQASTIDDSQRFFGAISVNTTLRVLELPDNQLVHTDHIGEMLKTNNTLRTLDLRGNEIEDIRPLANGLYYNSSLRTLVLKGNRLNTANHLGQVIMSSRDPKHKTALELLDLSGCSLRDVSRIADALRRNTTLRVLNLGDNEIANVNAFAAALVENTTLQELDLNTNPLEDIRPLEHGVMHGRGLVRLNVSSSGHVLGDRAQYPFGEALQHNSTLRVLDMRLFSAESIASLAEGLRANSTLEELYLGAHTFRRLHELVDALIANRGLQKIGIDAELFGDERAAELNEIFSFDATHYMWKRRPLPL